MEYAFDMQGFLQPGNDFVVKELAIVSLNDESDPKVFLFQEPFPWQRLTSKYRKINQSLEFNHGLSWNSGKIQYSEISNVLREYLSDAKRVYVKGKLKKNWLKRFNLPVCEVASIDFSEKPTKCATICLNHKILRNRKINCALHNVGTMKKIIQKNLEWQDMEWEEIQY